MKIKIVLLLCFIGNCHFSNAQNIPVPSDMNKPHPRVLTTSVDKSSLNEMIENDEWAQRVYQQTKQRLDPYVDRHVTDPEWIVSRLQMYWNSKADQPYINGGKFSHAEGEAPVPTVRFPGTRDNTTNYRRPRLEDVKPYMDDTQGVYLQNGSKEGDPWEWAEPSQTGRIIESINREIIGLAQTAAFLYWASGEEKYAIFASDIFDTYMTGIYHLKPPIDISNGHHQTLVGYTSFEVIQENNLDDLTVTYDFLYDYLQKSKADKTDLYVTTFKKWADQIIKNGVTFNNWNLHQARHIGKVAVILENNEDYADGKGAQYYLNEIMNEDNIRQWSMTKLLDYGYDAENGVWNESPGYAMGMVHDFLYFVDMYERQFDIDLIPHMPVLVKASEVLPEYMLPSGLAVGFGDTHYSEISTESMKQLIRNAQRFGKQEQERKFTRLLKFMEPEWEDENASSGRGNNWKDLFSEAGIELKRSIPEAKPEEVMSPLFYAPNVSWLVQRSGLDKEQGLMISQVGSYGNHAHANGIAMELYGKGLPLSPEKGIGTSYFSIDYDEYYSRFPAHNTVVVNGISNYPEMKSNHPFKHLSSYPPSGEKLDYAPGMTFSDLYFYEPETASDQRRQMGIVRTGEEAGYYVDIFRSKQQDGDDIKHDYFFHNLGQEIEVRNADGEALDLEETDRLGFADGDLMGYDYLWDKKVGKMDNNLTGTFSLETSDRTVNMHFWAKGDEDREIFTLKTPESRAMRGGHVMEESLEKMAIPAFLIRQNGAAWNRPFVAVYEPSTGKSSIGSVDYFGEGEEAGIKVRSKSGREDVIFSTTSVEDEMKFQNISFTGTYGVVSRHSENFTLFLGNGKSISDGKYAIKVVDEGGTAILRKEDDQFHFSSNVPVRLIIQVDRRVRNPRFTNEEGSEIEGTYDRSSGTVTFTLSAASYQSVEMGL